MTDNLLSGDPATDTVDPNKDYYQELVGDGKKFKDNASLARGKYESDLYIKTMEKRLDEMRRDQLKLQEESTSRAKLEELIDQLKTQQLSSSDPPSGERSPEKPTIDPKEIESLVSSKIQEHEASKRQQANFDTVRNKLKERFGANYQTVLKEQIEDLGLTEDFVNDLARKHPAVLFKTLGLDSQQQQENFQTPPRSNQRTDNFTPKTTKRTWSYYQNLKKENPKLYWDPKTTVQMHNDAIELGESFQDGDWNAI